MLQPRKITVSSTQDGEIRACATLERLKGARGVDGLTDWVRAVPCLALHGDPCTEESKAGLLETGLPDLSRLTFQTSPLSTDSSALFTVPSP